MQQVLGVSRHFIAGVIFVCSFVNAPSTDAATFYVATTGSNSNPGSETQPFQTINKGVGALSPGDTLYIKRGTYREWLDWDHKLPTGTSWSAPVTVKAFPGDTVTLRPNAGVDFVLRFIETRYIIIDGLILDGTNVRHDVMKITWETGHPPAHHIRIQNSKVRNSPKHGILITTGSDNNEFINVDLHHNGDNDFEHGIYIKSKNNLIQECRIYQNSGWGVHVFNSNQPGAADNNRIIKNKIYDNARVGKRGFGIILGSGSGNKAYNNLLWGNHGGIQIAYNGSSNAKVYNNTIYGNKGENGYCIHVGNSKDDRVKNNICWANDYDIADNGTRTELSGNLLTDPHFINTAGLDFQLQEESPGVDAGLTVSGVLDDVNGTSRPQGSKYDIGAYELIGGGVDTDPPAPPKGLKLQGN